MKNKAQSVPNLQQAYYKLLKALLKKQMKEYKQFFCSSSVMGHGGGGVCTVRSVKTLIIIPV